MTAPAPTRAEEAREAGRVRSRLCTMAAELESECQNGDATAIRTLLRFADLSAERAARAEAEVARLKAENERLRASFANGGAPCPYCTLPKEDWAKCSSGFPGCARADDAMLCPNVGASLEAEARVAVLEGEVAGWKRVAVIAAVPLEAMRMAGSYRMLAPTTQTMVDEAVVTIRMAINGHSLPPEGDIDAGLAPARAALQGATHVE